jgi:hypothetical protein
MRRELWRVRLDPGKPIGTTSAPPPRHPSSEFPTVVGTRRDSDKVSRETGMSLSGAPRSVDPAPRRTVLLSSAIAFLLIASALTFGIYTTVGPKPQPAGPVGLAAPPLPAAANLEGTENPLVGAATTPPLDPAPGGETNGTRAPAAPNGTSGSTAGGTGAPTPRAGSAGATSAPGKPAGASGAGKRAPGQGGPGTGTKTSAGGDLYRPF